MRVLGYIRVSTAEQVDSSAGLDAQRQNIGVAVQEREFELVDVLVDAGYSAKNTKRPALQEALRRLKHHEVDGLMVARLDRLSRSVMDFATIMERAQNQGWKLVLVDSGLDTSTPQGQLVANVLATMAQFERQLISQRTKEAMAVKKAAGTRFGRPRSMPDEVREHLRGMHNNGMTFTAIAKAMNEERVPTAHDGERWWPATVRAALQAA